MNDFAKILYLYLNRKEDEYRYLLEQTRYHIQRKDYDYIDCLNELELLIRIAHIREIHNDLANLFFRYL